MNWLTGMLAAFGIVAASVVACGHASGADSDSAGENFSATAACTVLSVKEGRVLTADELGKLNDPIANLVLKGEGCPTTFAEIQTKLAKTDPCAAGEPGLSTRLVTDRAQLLEKPDTYRAVMKRACQKRRDHELLMNVFGIATQADATGNVTASQVPQTTIEVIGEQKSAVGGSDAGKTTGVFNFYAREDNQWKFFGSSTDFLSQGYECNDDGACIPKAATAQRCASCHVGGGLVMKELESPWVNWEGGRTTPGAKDVVAKNPELFGRKGDGVDLESSIERGNREDWIPARVALLKSKGLKEVLRPLFCTVDMNLASRAEGPASRDLLVDRTFNGGFPGSVDHAAYLKAIADSGQKMIDGRSGDQLIGGKDDKPLVDTVFGFTFPMRSTQDSDYTMELQNQQIVDVDVVKDILSIDFTRPIYSPTRCALLEQVPDVPAADMHFDKVRAALIGAFDGRQDPLAKQLLASLQDQADAANHDFAVKQFLQACAARGKSEPAAYAADLVQWGSHLRKAAKRARNEQNGGIIEFAETLPDDDLPEPNAGFDPTTCKLPADGGGGQ